MQDALIELLDGLKFTRRPSAAVRLISGTTVSLLERVAVGTFSEQLFYRLNIIHLMAGDGGCESRGGRQLGEGGRERPLDAKPPAMTFHLVNLSHLSFEGRSDSTVMGVRSGRGSRGRCSPAPCNE